MKRKSTIAALISASLLVGCGETTSSTSAPAGPVVATQGVSLIDYQRGRQFVGRTEAMEDVAITAQVSGYLQARYFTEGEMVEKGQLLYQIDPSVYEAKVVSAKAAIAQAEASLKRTELDWQRAKGLLPKGSISQSEFDKATADKLKAAAQLKAAKAQLKSAEIDLSFTRVTAPFSGRISDSKVSIGDLVSPASGVLTTLVSLDPMQTTFNVSERHRLNLGLDGFSGSGEGRESVEVVLTLNNGEEYAHPGTVDFIGNRIELDTGTIAVRAKFANPEQQLLPGQHVQVLLREKTPVKVPVIPRRAVQSDLEGDFVMVLTDGEIAERRNVVLGAQTEQGVIVREGVNPGDVVLTKGLQRVRNGMTVRLEQTQA